MNDCRFRPMPALAFPMPLCGVALPRFRGALALYEIDSRKVKEGEK